MSSPGKSVPRVLAIGGAGCILLFVAVAHTRAYPGFVQVLVRSASQAFSNLAGIGQTDDPDSNRIEMGRSVTNSAPAATNGPAPLALTNHTDNLSVASSYRAGLAASSPTSSTLGPSSETNLPTPDQLLRGTKTSATQNSQLYENLRADHSVIVINDIDNFSYIAGSGDLSTPANYAGNVAPGNGQDIAFANAGGGVVTNTTLTSVNSLTFDSGSGGFTLSGNALAVNAGITNNGGSAQTINNSLSLGADQSFNASSGALSFGGSVNTNGKTLTVTGDNNTTFLGRVTGSGNLIKNGNGATYLTASYSGNGHTGSTTIDGGTLNAGVGSLVQTSSIQVNGGGTLILSGTGRHIGANTGVTLNGGIFNTGGFSEPTGTLGQQFIGALTLTATSIIDFGSGSSSILEFSGLGPHAQGSSTLQIINWDGTPVFGGSGDRLLFNGVITDFTGKFLQSDVSFNGTSGYTAIPILIGTDNYYEIAGLTPVPEPSTWAAGILAVGAIAFSQLRKGSRAGGRRTSGRNLATFSRS